MLLDAVKQLDGIIQRLLVAGSSGIFAQAIDHEPDGVELLLGIFGIAQIVHRPVGAAKLVVVEILNNVVLDECCRHQVLRIAQHAVGSREGPQDAGREDAALVGVFDELALTGHLAVETAVLVVYHIGQPKVQDVVFQHILNFGFQRLDIVVHLTS